MQLDKVMLDKLESWFETYNPDSMLYGFDIDEEDEELMYKDYQELIELLGRAKRNELTDDDVDVISFHIECIEIDKIKSFACPTSITVNEDYNLDYPFILDVEDSSYFYANKLDRDSDYIKLKELLFTAKNLKK